MHALVTGGAGFIGSHIVEALVARGDTVTVLDALDPRVHPPGPPHLPPQVRLIRGDILDPDALRHAYEPTPDVVFHEAAIVGLGRGAADAERYYTTNVGGTLRVLAQATRMDRPPRVVLASTMALYGEGTYLCPTCDVPRPAVRRTAALDNGQWDPLCPVCQNALRPIAVTEDHPPVPQTVYAASKHAQEQAASIVARDTGIPLVALRYHNVYGPRMPRDTPYAGVASFFKSRILAGKPPLVHEDGTQLRDFVHVEDIAQANLLAATAPLAAVDQEAFNIGSGDPRPIHDLATVLARTIDPDVTPELSGTYRPGDARHVFASIEKARRVLGYTPRVAFEAGVMRFVTDPTRAAPVEAPH